jgi:valyl-tRNA synthetase
MGIVDPEAERARLQKQHDTLTRGMRGIEGKLGNEGFLNKAPAELVQSERKRLESLTRELEAVKESLAALD